MSPQIAIAPVDCPVAPAPHAAIVKAVVEGGGEICEVERAQGLIWVDFTDPGALEQALEQAPELRWVQLVTAGVDLMRPLFSADRIWTSAKGLYSEPIAEYIVATLLSEFRSIPRYVAERSWTKQPTRTLLGANVTIVGGGGIAAALIAMLQPWRCQITVVRRTAQPMPGTVAVVPADQLHNAVRDADVVVLALALTDDTVGIIDASVLAAMPTGSWLVNVARGPHVDAAALVDALTTNSIAGAILDVTDPEPLPADHRLWQLDNCLITPHTSCPSALAQPYLLARIVENVRRFSAGDQLDGLVDIEAGY
jgi:phosphoglycerate dehydrogenase-like enzyme